MRPGRVKPEVHWNCGQVHFEAHLNGGQTHLASYLRYPFAKHYLTTRSNLLEILKGLTHVTLSTLMGLIIPHSFP